MDHLHSAGHLSSSLPVRPFRSEGETVSSAAEARESVDEAKMLENLPGEAGVEDRAVADLREGESV